MAKDVLITPASGKLEVKADNGTTVEAKIEDGNIVLTGTLSASGYNDSNWNTGYSWGNHASAGYATETYVGTQIANLIASAPETLNTLNELAEALGDDPNFATTMTNALASKITASSTETLTNKSGNISMFTNDSGYLTSETSHSDVIVDGDFASEGLMKRAGAVGSYTIVADDSANWNTAYGWGNHASQGYITDGNTNWDNSYGFITASSTETLTNKSGAISQWTNDSNYLTSETSHTDVVVDGDFASEGLIKRGGSSGSYSIITDNSSNWNTAYTHSQQSHAPSDAEKNVQSDWNASDGDSLILNKPNVQYTSAIPEITSTVGGLFSDSDSVKFASIETGAEVNVKSDWNSSSGDSEILNKPNVQYTSAIPEITATVGGLMSDADAIKFAGIATGATNVTNNNQLTNGAGFITASSTETLTNKSGNISMFTNDSGYLTSETSHTDVVVDGDFTSEGLIKRGGSSGSYSIVTDNSSNWDTAYTHSQQSHAPADAEKNVNADWNSSSGDSEILNKPNVQYTSAIPEITSTVGGLMSNANAIKFAGIAEGATAYTADQAVNTDSNVQFATIGMGGANQGMALIESSTIYGGTITANGGSSSDWNTAYTHSQQAHAPSNAEQNVNSDWNSSSGDSEILNKPNVQYTSAIPEITATVGGLMSNADAVKFAGIATGATNVTDNNQIANGAGYITDGNTGWDNSYGFITASSTETLTNKSGNISQWTNDSNYITDGNTNWDNSYGFITASTTDTLTNKSGNISQWTNDSNYLTGNQTITLSGDVSGSGTTSITTTVADDSHNHSSSSGDFLVAGGDLLIGGAWGNNHYNSTSGQRLSFGGGNDFANYSIGTAMNNYGGNYTKLDIKWHTGIRMGAQQTYGGIRFYDSEDLGTVIFSIGTGDAHVRVINNLYVGGNLALHAGNYSSYANLITNNNQITNGAGYITDGNTNWDNSYGFITASSTETLSNKSGNISQWTNDSNYATQAYVGTQVANIVDSAPGTLDTLNELAEALGDDANFSTTVTNSIATKLPLAGGTMSGNIQMGTSGVIYFNNNTSYGVGAGGNNYNSIWVDTLESGSNTDWLELTYYSGHGVRIGTGVNGSKPLYASILYQGGNQVIDTGGTGLTKSGSTLNVDASQTQITSVGTIGTGTWEGTAIADGYISSSSNWNTAYGWGNHATGGYITGNQTITLSGDVSGSGTTAITVTVANDSHTHNYVATRGNYVWSHNDLASTYDVGIQTSFVRTTEGWQEYGAVLHVGARGSTDAGGDFQLYMGHGTSNGGTHLQVRSADNDLTNDAWTAWKTILDTGNWSSYITLASLGYTGATNANYITNNNQLTNGAGYITGYTETDTLQSVIGRGATTDTQITSSASIGLRVDSGTWSRIEIDGNGSWAYTRLYNNATVAWDIACLNGGDLEWRPAGGATGRMTLSQSGNLSITGTITASAYNNSNWDTAYGWGNHASAGYASSGHTHSYLPLSGGTMTGTLTLASDGAVLHFPDTGGTMVSRGGFADAIGYNANYGMYLGGGASNASNYIYAGGYFYDGSTVQTLLHSGNYSSYANLITNNNQLTNGAGYITGNQTITLSGDASGSGTTAITVTVADDSHSHSNYISNSGTQSITNYMQFVSSAEGIGSTNGSQSALECYNGTVGNDAFMSFHVGGDYAVYFGLDGGTNKLSVGGWSMGSNIYEIYHSGNKPSLSDLGFTGASNANYITNNNQLTNGSGYTTYSANQALDTSSSPTFADAYTNGWWRNNEDNEGIYNQTNGNHFYSTTNYWEVDSPYGFRFRDGYGGTIVGYVYWDGTAGSNNFGLLSHDGSWSVQCTSTATYLHNASYVDGNLILHAGNYSSYANLITNNNQLTNGAGYSTYSANQALDTSSTPTFAEVRSTGDIIAYYSSDRRLKDELKPIKDPIAKIRKLTGYTFTWNELQNSYIGEDVGVVAQEVNEVVPEVVTERDDGYLAVKYEKMIPLLIEAMKEQQDQIDELTRQVKELRK